jgi:hypothetical protein
VSRDCHDRVDADRGRTTASRWRSRPCRSRRRTTTGSAGT